MKIMSLIMAQLRPFSEVLTITPSGKLLACFEPLQNLNSDSV